MDNFLSSILQNTQGAEFGLAEFFISIVFSLLVGIICMFLYRLYFIVSFDRNESLTRSFVIIAPSISAVFWAIQYSLPLSLGLLGALSFVRFRTPIKKAEDIGFILLVIALALLSSVYRFFAAGILLSLITVVIMTKVLIIDKRLPFLKMGSFVTLFVSTKTPDIAAVDSEVRNILSREFSNLKDQNLTFNDVVQKDEGYSFRYSVYFKRYEDSFLPRAIAALKTIQDVDRVEVFYGKNA
jgi:hypothetical protein